MSHMEVIIVAGGYCVCLLVVIGLSYIELRKRKHLQILSWNGKTNRKDSHATIPNGRTQTQEKTKEFILGSLHYLSMMIYLGSTMICVGGLVRSIPNFCEQWTLGLYLFGVPFTKAFILLFQLQRYYLCFVQDFVNKSTYTDSVKLKRNIFTMLFYIIAIISIILALSVIGFIIIIVVNEHNLYSWQGIWCTWIAHKPTVRYKGYVITGGSFIFLDWLILCLFFGTLRALWTKLRQFQSSIDNRHNINNDINDNNDNNSNINGKARSTTATATTAGIERLQWILTRVFVCSMFMEMSYLIATTLNFFFPVGTFGWSLSHVAYGFDCVMNVIMTNFILQHNTKEYKRFIACLSKVCCNRQYICGFNIKHETMNEHYLKKEISQKVENNNQDKKKQGTNPHDYEQTLDTAVLSSVVTETASDRDITMEKSYFTSQNSKDEDM